MKTYDSVAQGQRLNFALGLVDEEIRPQRGATLKDWLALDAPGQELLIRAFQVTGDHETPQDYYHAAVHMIIETQIARGEPFVEEAVARLVANGISRHEAIHVIAKIYSETVTAPEPGDVDGLMNIHAVYHAQLQILR